MSDTSYSWDTGRSSIQASRSTRRQASIRGPRRMGLGNLPAPLHLCNVALEIPRSTRMSRPRKSGFDSRSVTMASLLNSQKKPRTSTRPFNGVEHGASERLVPLLGLGVLRASFEPLRID